MQAFYTIVQFIPDVIRDERVNIAVILQCPERGYSKMKTRTYMDKIISEISPTHNATAIRLITQGIQRRFSSAQNDKDLYPDTSPIHVEFLDTLRHDYSLLQFAQTKTIVIEQNDDLDARVERLFARFIQIERVRSRPNNITRERVVEASTQFLVARHVPIITSPPIFPGALWKNRFDALHRSYNRRHLYCLSFDLKEPSFFHARAFVQSVADLKQLDEFQDDEFAVVVQPPTTHRGHQDDFVKAMTAFTNQGIHTYQNVIPELERLSRGLENRDGLAAA